MTSNKYYEELREEFIDRIFLDHEKVRLREARRTFEYNEEDIPSLMDIYRKWVAQHEYFILEIRARNPESMKLEERTWAAVKCSKRGNDVYSSRVRKRLQTLNKAGKHFENVIDDRKPDRNLIKTNMLYVTLTYNINRSSMASAWRNVGKEWNQFLTKLRSKYGKVSILRCWEAYENGYCHIHAFVIFHEHEFTAFHHSSNNKKNRDGSCKEGFRILRRSKNDIAQMWHSHVDILAVTNIGQAVKNVLWYIGKNLTKHKNNICDKELLTYVATWYWRKQSFAMSKNLIDLINANCIIQENSIIQSVQLTLEGDKFIIEFIFLGIMLGERIQIPPEQWMEVWKKRPDWVQELSESQ